MKRLNASCLTDQQKNVPQNIWAYFENQLTLNINFRIYRLQLMQFRQISNAKALSTGCWKSASESLNQRKVSGLLLNTTEKSANGVKRQIHHASLQTPTASVNAATNEATGRLHAKPHKVTAQHVAT